VANNIHVLWDHLKLKCVLKYSKMPGYCSLIT